MAPEGTGDRNAGGVWLRLAAALAALLVLVLAVVLAFNLGRESQEAGPGADQSASPSAGAQPADAVKIAGISDFDPQASPAEENPDQARLAIDGDPSTAWHTMTYFGNPELGGLKDGVGLLVDLGEPVEVTEVRLRLDGRPTSLDVLAADEGASRPTSVDGLTRVASVENADRNVTLELEEPFTTRYLVVWLTSLPKGSGGYVGRVAEIDVLS